MTTAARIEANRKNAQKSTGPKSAEGKAKSARNAVTHGLTAKVPVVLPCEDESEYLARLKQWFEDFPPADMIQRTLIERAAHAAWRLERLARREAAVLSGQARRAADDFDRVEHHRVADLGTRLLHDPLNRCADVLRDPDSLKVLRGWQRDDPAVLVRELERSEQGADWLLARWAEMDNLLDDEGYWHYDKKFQAVRMLGKRFEDVLNDPAVLEIFLACQVAHIEAWDFWDECFQATLGAEGRPVYHMKVDHLAGRLPATKAEAVAILRRVIDAEVARLNELKNRVLAPLAAADRAEAADRVLFEEGPSVALVIRYEAAAAREFHKCVGDLVKLRKDNPGPAESAAQVEPEEAITPEPDAPRASRRRAPRNEPKPDRPGGSPRRRKGPPEGALDVPRTPGAAPKAP